MKVPVKKQIVTIIAIPILIPFILAYFFSKQRLIIQSDVGGVKEFCYRILCDKPYRSVFYHRIGYLKYFLIWLLPRCPHTKINKNTLIGHKMRLVHGYMTFLNARAIGHNFTCFHNVTLGAMKGGVPTIGNNVTISPGVVILGNVYIGNNVTLGAGTVVTKDIPDNCTVIGNPPHIIRLNNKNVDIPLFDNNKKE